MTIREARYFPVMIEWVAIGRVMRVSMVPVFHSSVSSRMVVAGIKTSSTKGARIKKFSRVA